MYTVCVPFVVWLKYFFLIKKIKIKKINSAKTFIAVPVLSLAKGGGKFFNTQFSHVDIYNYYTVLQMSDLLHR